MSLSSGLELRHSAGLSSSNGQLARTRNGHHCIRRDTASRRELGRSMTNTTTSATASASAATVLVTCSMPHECIAARLRPNLANVISETTNSAEHHETLGSFNSATRHMPQVSTGVIGTSGVASIEEVSSSHNHHNHHYHNHHHHHHHHHRHHRHWHHLNSNGSPLTIWHRREKKSRKSSIESLLSHLCGLSFSRAIVARPMTRSMIHRTFLMLVIIVSLSPHSSSSGLDSPVKVQRNKQLQLQQQQQLQPAINASWPLSSDHLSRQQQQQQTSSDGANANHLKIDRVRRTNSALDPAATRSNQNQQRASQHQRDCPSNRLIQSLLPPEYAGSPAASQRPSMARAHCECQSDPLGWHVTCFAGSAGAGGGVGPASSNGLGGGASGGLGRTPGGSTVPPMPNQLHPAFRNSQMARQQQQQAAVASGRRHRRSSDSDADQAGPSSAQPGHELGDEASSSHEGFGEDPSSMAHNSGQQHHQPASTNVGTKPAAFQKQRDARAQAQTQHQQQQQNRQETVNYITSFSSDQDIDQPQEAGQRDARNGSEQGRPQQQNRPNSAREAPASERLVSAASSVYSQHLTFQPVPVLFSVTYLRNNMIEIDCDQSVPNYRAAMFRGFTVNEISTFVFNNCQLPNIPFSVLLHRTRTAPAAPDAAGHLQAPAAGPSSDEIVVPLAAGAPKQNQRQPQALKPNRRQQFGGGSLQRRRRQAEDETTTTTTMTPVGEEEEIGEARSANGRQSHRAPQSHQQQQQAATNGGQTGSQTQTGPDEPKVKSLAINLNAIVDQRTLITLLTGLDLLEELQLNYMQLNLTNFINHLQQASSSIPTTTLAPISSSMASMESSTSAPSADSSPAPKTTSSTLSGPSSSSPNPDELSPAASANLDFGSASSARVVTPTNQVPSPSTSSMSAQQQTSRLSSPMTITPSSTTTSTTTTTTTTTTTSTTTTTTPPPASATTMMNPNTLKPFRKQPSTFGTTNSATGGPTTGPTVTSTTTNHRPSSVSSSTVTGPSIGLGAPRGLVIAQATGMPPPMTTMVVSTTPLTTSTNSQNNHHHHQQLHSSGSVPLTSVHSSVSTSSSSSTEQSSSSPHQTTTANRSSSPGGNTLQPQSNGTTSITTTSSLGPGQRNQPDGSHLISIGMGPQSQSVSYTALGPPSATTNTQSQSSRTTRPQSGMFHLPPATTTTITSSSQPPSSSTLMSSSSSSSSSAPSTTPNNQQQQQLNPNRLHQSPSAWTASSSRASQPAQTTTGQLAAGSRLSMFNGGSSGQSSGPSSSSDLLISATSSAPPSTPPSSSQVLSWSAISVSPATAALTTSPVNSPGLSAPANTPSFTATSGQPTTTTSISTSSSSSTSSAAAAAATTNPVGGSSYGFRTGGSQQQQQASNPTTTNQNMRTITTVQQSRRQPTATTIATSAANTNLPQADQTSSSGQGGFIAAGVRLHQQQAAGGLGNQRRFHPQPQQQHQYQPATGLPPATSTSRFSSSSFSSSSSSSSGANPVSVGSDDQFVSHQDTPPASHDHVPRSPTLIASFQSGRRRNHHNSPANDDDETNRANNRNNNHEEDDDDESLDPNTSTTPNLERISRTATRSKRAASPTGPSFEEFELSFGDLLPSLRTLKLESFIDLSPLVAGANSWSSTNVASPGSSSLSSGQRNQQQQQPGPTRKRTGQSGASLIRFKRQPKPDDASPTKLAREPGEPLMADESNQERNSVMVDENSRHIHSPSSSSDRDDQPDVEPGETLWRSASSRSSSSVDASGDDHDDDDDSDGPHVSVAAAPASMTNTSGGGGGAGSHQSGTNAAAASDQTEAELTWAESQLHQRQRQFSAFILGRLFSRLHKLQVLHLTSNEIPYWPDNVLQDSRNSLIRLYLISNNIRQLGARSFAQLVALRSLDLSSNQLRHLDPDLLRDSIELRQLRACRNLFRRLPLKLMMKQPTSTGSGGGGSGGGNALAKLESVDFSKNKYLAEFQLDHHQTASQQLHPLSLAPIVSLNLSDCSLGDQLLTFGSGSNNSNNQNATLTMNQLLFAALGEHLTSVSLKNNKFRELLNTPNLFGKNRQLKSVDLSHNQLERLNSHLFNGNASQIQELRLNHNKLTELPDQFLFNLRKLRYLSLAHNKLAQLNSKLFITNQLLESLDLSKNQITTLNTQSSGQIPFGNGANLRRLSLAYNNLTDFEQDVFDIAWSFYTQLQHLDLSHNKFSGQIQMPIFYTITDQMMFNLGSNGIQSVSVDALVQHEQVIDRYATSFEALGTNEDDPDSSSSSSKPARSHSGGGSTANQANSRGPPTVFIRLGNNPLACDCMLEPLVSYTRRVAAASNPALVASLFNQQQQQSHSSTNNQLAGLPAGSKYSFASPNNQQQQSRGQQQQPQVLYQFRFNNLHCDQPKSLQRRLLNHISIGDLLCPIQDERLCPHQCECHYQSAFKTVIVDCNGRQLAQVPGQLSDASNFNQFEVLTSFNLSSTASNRLTISHVDKIIIRLDNNRLESIDELSHLFQVIALQQPGTEQSSQQHQSGAGNLRFARAVAPSDGLPEGSNGGGSRKKISPVVMAARLQQLQQQRQTREATVSSAPLVAAATEETPLATVGSAGGGNSNNYLDAGGANLNEHYLASGAATSSSSLGADFESVHHRGSGVGGGDSLSPTAPALHPPMSTAVLESAEEFRNKHYSQKSCELYLDHNNIDSLPDSFLAALDQIRASSLQASSTPPQGALPTAMLEPPIHTKLNSLHVAADPSSMSSAAAASAPASAAVDPMKTSASSLYGSISSSEEPPVSSLFGRQPFAAEKKAALMESVQQSVRFNKLQQQHQQQQQDQNMRNNNNNNKFTVSPSLAVLSLRYNNLGNLKAKTLNRLSKLIKSSGTRLYFGHNPFNCSDNFALESYDNTTISSSSLGAGGDQAPSLENGSVEDGLVASPMGDQLLAASDSVSGAYLEPSPDDLTPSASGESSAAIAANSIDTTSSGKPYSAEYVGPLTPTDCPVGQLKTWLTRHHSHIGDLDELYCVHMPQDLANKLKVTGLSTGFTNISSNSNSIGSDGQPESRETDSHDANGRQKARRQVGPSLLTPSTGEGRREHDHPWTSSLNSPTLTGNGGGGVSNGGDQSTIRFVNFSQLSKNGVTWNAESLMASAKLIDLDLYDLCPYSNIQLLDSASLGYLSLGHQRALMSLAVVFIIISLCLLLMLIYFGDTQTILAFVYIHMNPIYKCLHLTESHLDGEKLYDAFVSYSSADRDIVMELIEHLEQPGGQFDGQRLLSDGKGTNLDRSRDVLVTEDDLRPDLIPSPLNTTTNGNQHQALGTLQRRSTSTLSNSASSFQDLSTMSRSTSRMMLDAGDYTTSAHSQQDISSSPALRNEPNNNNNNSNSASNMGLQLNSGSTDKILARQQMHQLSTNRPYRLCIHERDWLPGHLISWNIVNSVQNSRRTILILSKEFIKSVWFQVEFHTAYYQMLEDKIDRLIVIVRGELPPKHELDKNLAFLLTTKTYLTWGEKWFWERLHYALPHRAGPPPPLAVSKSASKPAKQQQQQPRLKKQQAPVGQSHRSEPPQSAKLSGSAAGLLSSLAAGHADPPKQQQQQQSLIMSNIGKDCSRLLMTSSSPTNGNRINSSSSSSAASSGSSGSSNTLAAGQVGGGARSASASSFLSGASSTNQLFRHDTDQHNQIMTTSNDLLSSPISPKPSGGGSGNNNTTRLSVGGGGLLGMRSSSPLQPGAAMGSDGPGLAGVQLSESQSRPTTTMSTTNTGNTTTTTIGGITSIMLDGNQTGPNSRARSKKQEKLQSFVEKEISSRFNLSEL